MTKTGTEGTKQNTNGYVLLCMYQRFVFGSAHPPFSNRQSPVLLVLDVVAGFFQKQMLQLLRKVKDEAHIIDRIAEDMKMHARSLLSRMVAFFFSKNPAAFVQTPLLKRASVVLCNAGNSLRKAG